MAQETPQISPLSDAEARDLRCLVDMMIPASAEYDVPGAGDDAIFADILASLGRDLPSAHAVLRDLAHRSGGRFVDLGPAQQEEAVAALRTAEPDALAIVNRVVLLCYYRDDRVMRSLGLEARAPFPKGFPLEHGDWSLLDPVRQRPKLWRDVPRRAASGTLPWPE